MTNKIYKILLLFFLILMFFTENINAKTVKVKINSNPKGAAVIINNGSRLPSLTPTTHEFKIGNKYIITFVLPGIPPINVVYKCDGSPINFNFPGFSSSNDKDDKIKVKVQINSNPQGAYFTISDHDKTYITPTVHDFTKGEKYFLTFNKAGFYSKTLSYKCNGSPIYVNLDPIPVIINYSLTVDSNIKQAEVFINNNKFGNTPLNTTLKEGIYEIKVIYPGFKIYNVTISLKSNQKIYANLTRDTNILKVDSNIDRAEVFINNERKGSTPFQIALTPGVYEVKVKAEGYKPYKISVNLESNQNIYANLEPDNKYIILKIPKGTNVFINGEKQAIKWQKDDDEENIEWRSITLYSPQEWNEIKVKFHGIYIVKRVRFDGSTLTLNLNLE